VKLVCMSIDVSELREFLDDALPLVEPQTVADWNRRGDLHYENKRYDLALADYNAALRLDPRNAEAKSNRGRSKGGDQRGQDSLMCDGEWSQFSSRTG